jgi:LysM repeat protein
MIIKAYAHPDFTGERGQYTVRVNPEQYSQDYAVSYGEQGAAGGGNVPLQFKYMAPPTMNFELLFDATGAIPNSAADLTAELQSFLAIVYNYQGTIHEPYYLKVFWGTLAFGARLTSLKLEYTLFRPDGSPLRAKASVSFKNYVDPATLAKLEDKKSADLTHVLTVKAGDTLPRLCHHIYGDATLYPKVAAANGLTHFRNLRPGMRLVFPPLR